MGVYTHFHLDNGVICSGNHECKSRHCKEVDPNLPNKKICWPRDDGISANSKIDGENCKQHQECKSGYCHNVAYTTSTVHGLQFHAKCGQRSCTAGVVGGKGKSCDAAKCTGQGEDMKCPDDCCPGLGCFGAGSHPGATPAHLAEGTKCNRFAFINAGENGNAYSAWNDFLNGVRDILIDVGGK